MDLARIWLDNCIQNHRPCQKLIQPGALPLWIVDVSNPKSPFLAPGNDRIEPYVLQVGT